MSYLSDVLDVSDLSDVLDVSDLSDVSDVLPRLANNNLMFQIQSNKASKRDEFRRGITRDSIHTYGGKE